LMSISLYYKLIKIDCCLNFQAKKSNKLILDKLERNNMAQLKGYRDLSTHFYLKM